MGPGLLRPGEGGGVQHVETTYARANWVHMGEYLMPAGWLARFDNPEYPFTAELQVEMEDGGDLRPVCKAVWITARDGAKGIDGASLRLPVSQILKVSAASVAMRVESGDPGRWAPVGDGDLEAFYRRFHTKERPPGRQPLDADRLRLVSRVYQGAAPTGAPVEAVRVALSVSRAHAGRLVMLARRRTDPVTGRPFLPPVGRPGVADPADDAMLREPSKEEGERR